MDWFREVDKEKYTADDMPIYPARTLIGHVAVKGLQVGSVAGLFVISPALWMFRKVPLAVAANQIVPISTFLGATVTFGLLYGKSLQGDLDADGVDDRAYRISKNVGQNTVDKYSLLTSLGATVAAALSPSVGIRSILTSSCSGVAVGVAYFVIEKSIEWRRLNIPKQ